MTTSVFCRRGLYINKHTESGWLYIVSFSFSLLGSQVIRKHEYLWYIVSLMAPLVVLIEDIMQNVPELCSV